jgi:hypothetical protein
MRNKQPKINQNKDDDSRLQKNDDRQGRIAIFRPDAERTGSGSIQPHAQV